MNDALKVGAVALGLAILGVTGYEITTYPTNTVADAGYDAADGASAAVTTHSLGTYKPQPLKPYVPKRRITCPEGEHQVGILCQPIKQETP